MIKLFILSIFLVNCATMSFIKDYPEFETKLYVLKKHTDHKVYISEHVYTIDPDKLEAGFELIALGRGYELIDYLNEKGGLACLDKKGLGKLYKTIYNSYLEIKRLK